MELSQQSIHDVIHPTAAFSEYIQDDDYVPTLAPGQSLDDPSNAWEHSFMNPKNRIDSLDLVQRPMWRIDGCTAFGSQFYAVPLFIEPVTPLRMDIFIPEPAKLPPQLRRVLDVDVAFHTTGKTRIASLGITRHVLRILQHWTRQMQDPMKIFKDKPFGSRIVLHNLPTRVSDAKIQIAPTHYLEHQLLSVKALQQFWGPCVELPPAIDISQVAYLSQLHDSVCLVQIEGVTWIFKALTSYTKYLFHELRHLLTIQPHPHIVSKPAHLVTKKCGFGSKKAILGFTLEYHVPGSLRDLIPFLQLHGRLPLGDRIKWSIQLASALVHLRTTSDLFYPDLRLENIVLSKSADVVMVDFEQRGVWCEFAAPEVNALEYVRLLATDDEIPADVTKKYSDLLTEILPGWEAMGSGVGADEGYSWPSQGFNVPWSCLTPTEQEACEVYMLGRVLWCIFEGSSAPQRAAVWMSYRWEPLVEFPGYTRTPEPMRQLIDRCTRGRQAPMSQVVVREGNKLVLRQHKDSSLSTAEQVQQTAKAWWLREIDESEKWLRRRIDAMAQSTWKENYYDRPSLREVLADLDAFRSQSGLAA